MAADVHRQVGAQRAGEDPDVGHPSEVGVGRRLDDLGGERPVGVARQRRDRPAVGPRDRRQRVLERRGEALHEQVEQLLHTHAGQRSDGQRGVEVAPGDRLLEVRGQRREVELVAGEVAVEQRLVLALGDDRLEQVGPQPLGERDVLGIGRALDPAAGGVVDDPCVEQRDETGDAAVVVVHRQVQRHHRLVEQPLAERHRLVEVGAGLVELADDDRPRDAEHGALGPQLRRHRVEPAGGRHDEQHGVRRPQTRPQLADEVRRAGGVEQRELHPGVLELGHAERHRAVHALLDVLAVEHARAVHDPAGTGHRAAVQEQRLDERGLAGAAVADDGDVADEVRRARRRRGARVVRTGPLGVLGHARPSRSRPRHPPGASQPAGAGPTGQGRRARRMARTRLRRH